MATLNSELQTSRLQARRRAVMDEALDHAVSIIEVEGAGAVTVSEIARRIGIKAPSLYKYFPSLHAIYDALFERGNLQINAYVDEKVDGVEPGVARLRAASHGVLEWSGDNRGLAQLMFWRPIPGFTPSPQSFLPSQALWERFRADLATAARSRQLGKAADSDEVMRMLTVILGGIASQQMANDPHATAETGVFARLTDPMLDVLFGYYSPKTRGKA